MMRYMLDRLVEVAKAAGAFEYRLQDYIGPDGVYRTPAWHLLGTCRMGATPETSVVNSWHQTWDVPNLFIVDGSAFATGGVVNPDADDLRAGAARRRASARQFPRAADGHPPARRLTSTVEREPPMQVSSGEADPSGASRGEHFVCTDCGHAVAIADMPSTCPRCDGILDLVFAERPEREADHVETPGIWHWRKWLPDCAPENRVTLGEGLTPLLRLPSPRRSARTCLAVGQERRDHADRLLQGPRRRARDIARQALRKTGPGALFERQCRRFRGGLRRKGRPSRRGARAGNRAEEQACPDPRHRRAPRHREGNTSDCCRLAKAAAERFGWVNLTTTYYNPLGVDACATIAYEIAALRPDVLLLPISSGPLLAGVMKGFARLKRLGLVERVPRPVAVQPSRCAPIVRAFEDGGAVVAWQHEQTVASALNDTLAGYERDGDYTLAWLRRYDGNAVAVSDPEIIDAVRRLATGEGIFVEPSAAATDCGGSPADRLGMAAQRGPGGRRDHRSWAEGRARCGPAPNAGPDSAGRVCTGARLSRGRAIYGRGSPRARSGPTPDKS